MGMRPARRSIPAVRAEMLDATAGPCWPPAPPPAPGCTLGDVAAGTAAVCGGRAGAGAGFGDEGEHAEASSVATAPNERAARMSVEWRETGVVGARECLAGRDGAQ